MYWKNWVRIISTEQDWTLEQILQFVQLDCPEVTLEQVVEVIEECKQ